VSRVRPQNTPRNLVQAQKMLVMCYDTEKAYNSSSIAAWLSPHPPADEEQHIFL